MTHWYTSGINLTLIGMYYELPCSQIKPKLIYDDNCHTFSFKTRPRSTLVELKKMLLAFNVIVFINHPVFITFDCKT